jgi:hypothetical protein
VKEETSPVAGLHHRESLELLIAKSPEHSLEAEWRPPPQFVIAKAIAAPLTLAIQTAIRSPNAEALLPSMHLAD